MFKNLFSLVYQPLCFLNKPKNGICKKTIDYAINKHPTVQQSILKVDQRKQEITASKGMLLPSVSASTSQKL